MRAINPLEATRRITESYRRYLTAALAPRSSGLRGAFVEALGAFGLSKGPYLQASPPFANGRSLDGMIGDGILSPRFGELPDEVFPSDRPLRAHQDDAITKAVAGRRNLVVATGTGSGKTECFLFPIINHLLRESEAGTLSQPGVRALLMYPMNALANDQTKRLRRLLAGFPELTFGRYVGETRDSRDQAEGDFRTRYPDEPRIPNELLSREEMQAQPPHLLLTNYAMLEYLLLRPKDSPLFGGDPDHRWRFIVLDETHVYDGAQGIEVAMLLRRVRERVHNGARGKWQCFATSATLASAAEGRGALAEFAERLFDEPFSWNEGSAGERDIVEATIEPLRLPEARAEGLSPRLLQSLREEVDGGTDVRTILERIPEVAGILPAHTEYATVPELLWTLLSHDPLVGTLLARLQRGSILAADLSQALFPGEGESSLTDLIRLGSMARKNPGDAPLVAARYHLMLRALEGAFVCLHPGHDVVQPRVSLERRDECPSCKPKHRARMFELGTCRRCQAEYLIGVSDDTAAQPVNPDWKPKSILFLGEGLAIDDDDETTTEAPGDDEEATRWLCPGCGSLTGSPSEACKCAAGPAKRMVTLLEPAPGEDVVRRCACCGARSPGGAVARLETGADAPTAVIATALYQQLPPSPDARQSARIGEGRKLLTFSDSRQDAAFFAPYLERTYQRAMQRRLIADAIRKMAGQEPRVEDLRRQVEKAADHHPVFDPAAREAERRGLIETWLMQEVLSFDRRSNLEGTATARIRIAQPPGYEAPPALRQLGFTEQESFNLLALLLQTLRFSGAVTVPANVSIQDTAFAPRNREIVVREAGSARGVLAWMPPADGGNRRLWLLEAVLERKQAGVDPVALLREIWAYLTGPGSPWSRTLVRSQDRQHGPVWRLNHEALVFEPVNDGEHVGRCSQCQQIWWDTIAGVCPTYRCPGEVKPVADMSDLHLGHYARLYRETEPIGMTVQEHTAQFSAAKASSIQDEFTAGAVNVLSCSTTFEMGVDVGDVQSVFLRNVPPSPANYVQRAGRAGRRADVAALVVSFAQRRSHDLYYFSRPEGLVEGQITPPRIFLGNPAIVRRHMHSVALAAFLRENDEAHTVQDFFEPGPDGTEACSQRFIAWLRSNPQTLQGSLANVVPETLQEGLGIGDWGWVEALCAPTDEDPSAGWFTRAGEEVRDDLADLDKLVSEAVAKEDFRLADRLKKVRTTLCRRQLFGFLASRNVLPKYGFPVDVVELQLARSGAPEAAELELARDLALAISDYAPGSETAAGKALWRSAGLVVRKDRSWPRHKWALCKCEAFRHGLEQLPEACPACGEATVQRKGEFVIPLFGFIGQKAGQVGESRPTRSSSVRVYFGSYKDDPPEWVTAEKLSARHLVRYRRSRQGRITVINTGPMSRGFRICYSCGHGEAAPLATPATGRRTAPRPREHDDPRWPGRKCRGPLVHQHLGHEFLTDTVEIHLGMPMTAQQSQSTLYALLDGVRELDIDRNDVSGTLDHGHQGASPSFVLYDSVPGGAGHAQRIADRLPELLAGALKRVERCSCGEETSCYGCLRNYQNQLHHEQLSRGAAINVLRSLHA